MDGSLGVGFLLVADLRLDARVAPRGFGTGARPSAVLDPSARAGTALSGEAAITIPLFISQHGEGERERDIESGEGNKNETD